MLQPVRHLDSSAHERNHGSLPTKRYRLAIGYLNWRLGKHNARVIYILNLSEMATRAFVMRFERRIRCRAKACKKRGLRS